MSLQHRLVAFVCVVGLLGLANVSQAQVNFGNFEDSLTDNFGTGTNSGVTPNVFSSPTAGSVITPGSGSDLTKVLDLTATGFNGGLSSGAALGYDFVANGLLSQFMANDIITFNWEVAPSSATGGYSQLYNIILNGPGPGYTNVGGSSGSTSPLAVTTGTVNQNPAFSGQLNTVSINYDNYKAALSASPGYMQLEFQTNNGGGAPADIYFDNFTLSTVPEPASIVLAGLGLAGLGLVAKRRRNATGNRV
jgi:hypothetical protein